MPSVKELKIRKDRKRTRRPRRSYGWDRDWEWSQYGQSMNQYGQNGGSPYGQASSGQQYGQNSGDPYGLSASNKYNNQNPYSAYGQYNQG